MYMPGRLRTASSPSRMVIDWAPYSGCDLFFAAATVGQVSSELHRQTERADANASAPSLPSTDVSTDSETAFLHTQWRRMRNFTDIGASYRSRERFQPLTRLSAQ